MLIDNAIQDDMQRDMDLRQMETRRAQQVKRDVVFKAAMQHAASRPLADHEQIGLRKRLSERDSTRLPDAKKQDSKELSHSVIESFFQQTKQNGDTRLDRDRENMRRVRTLDRTIDEARMDDRDYEADEFGMTEAKKESGAELDSAVIGGFSSGGDASHSGGGSGEMSEDKEGGDSDHFNQAEYASFASQVDSSLRDEKKSFRLNDSSQTKSLSLERQDDYNLKRLGHEKGLHASGMAVSTSGGARRVSRVSQSELGDVLREYRTIPEGVIRQIVAKCELALGDLEGVIRIQLSRHLFEGLEIQVSAEEVLPKGDGKTPNLHITFSTQSSKVADFFESKRAHIVETLSKRGLAVDVDHVKVERVSLS